MLPVAAEGRGIYAEAINGFVELLVLLGRGLECFEWRTKPRSVKDVSDIRESKNRSDNTVRSSKGLMSDPKSQLLYKGACSCTICLGAPPRQRDGVLRGESEGLVRVR